MSDTSHATAHDEAHTGPIKTPKQLLLAAFFSFVIPIFVIIGLVYYVTSANKPAAGAVDTEKATAQRIQKVGMVEIRDANRPLKAGEEVYKAQCAACHTAGAAGAPKFADAAAWGVRIKQGLHFTRDKYGNPITLVSTDGIIQRQLGWAVNVNVLEEFTMPTDLVGIGHPKGSWNRQHLRLGSPIIEPGWKGFLTISLNYVGDEDLHVEPGAGIMQVIFARLESKAAYQGRYQQQPDCIVPAIVA